MNTSIFDERSSILRMIDDHKITADQGAQLLAALGTSSEEQASTLSSTSEGSAHYFHVLVKDTIDGHEKTRITIPIGLVRWGLKVGARYNAQLDEIDMQELANLITSGVKGEIIDVIDEEDNEHVQIFVD